MNLAVYLPLLLPVLLAAAARPLATTAAPERAARALAAAALLAATVSTVSLVLLALTLLDDLPMLEAREHIAPYPLPEPVPGPVALAAAAALAWAGWRCVANLRRSRAATRDLVAAGTAHDGLLVADLPEAHAVAVPAGTGRPGHVLVTAGLLRLLDRTERAAVLAHEEAHLRHRHHRTVAAAAAAAAVNPLLRPVARVVTLLVERSADEAAATAVGDRGVVARAIAKVALSGGGRPAGGLAAGGSDVTRRVAALTRPTGGRSHRATAGVAAVVITSAAAGGAAVADFVAVARAWL
ncbi:M56 family metallopeptidase [Dactylosporangium sp. AC04546]|uniref:M56 family metallopeptidase n=1 Tax=Dactylosporangium sp. AC04546 TaxID=2862460 RepID=UPI001EE061E0|nr:M56 family metallopeptidase [Dactylosporangium sp. AC04546]WVK88716.1 M56 family metallopeptidase [Dactylosporangium sp. AC04546]